MVEGQLKADFQKLVVRDLPMSEEQHEGHRVGEEDNNNPPSERNLL